MPRGNRRLLALVLLVALAGCIAAPRANAWPFDNVMKMAFGGADSNKPPALDASNFSERLGVPVVEDTTFTHVVPTNWNDSRADPQGLLFLRDPMLASDASVVAMLRELQTTLAERANVALFVSFPRLNLMMLPATGELAQTMTRSLPDVYAQYNLSMSHLWLAGSGTGGANALHALQYGDFARNETVGAPVAGVISVGGVPRNRSLIVHGSVPRLVVTAEREKSFPISSAAAPFAELYMDLPAVTLNATKVAETVTDAAVITVADVNGTALCQPQSSTVDLVAAFMAAQLADSVDARVTAAAVLIDSVLASEEVLEPYIIAETTVTPLTLCPVLQSGVLNQSVSGFNGTTQRIRTGNYSLDITSSWSARTSYAQGLNNATIAVARDMSFSSSPDGKGSFAPTDIACQIVPPTTFNQLSSGLKAPESLSVGTSCAAMQRQIVDFAYGLLNATGAEPVVRALGDASYTPVVNGTFSRLEVDIVVRNESSQLLTTTASHNGTSLGSLFLCRLVPPSRIVEYLLTV